MAKTAEMKLQWNFAGKVDPNLVAAAKAVTKNINHVKTAGNGVAKSLGSVASKAGSLMKYLSLGAVAGGIPSLILMAKSAADTANAFKDLSDETAVSVKSLSAWSHAANMNGLSNEDFAGSLKNLNKTLSNAAQGNQQAILTFKRAGVNIFNASGQVKTADQIMLEASNTFAKMPEGIYKSSLAMAMFGGTGSKMVALMQNGSGAINDLMNEAKELGIVFSDADARAGAEFNDSLMLLKKSVQGVSYSLGKQLYPLITPIVQSISKWVSANRELIATNVSKSIETFKHHLPAIKTFIIDAYTAIKAFAGGINTAVQAMGGWERVLKIVAGAFIAVKSIQAVTWILGIINAVGLLGKSLLTVIPVIIKFGMALLANPIGLIIAGITALVAAGYLLYKNWDTVIEWIKNIWTNIKTWLRSTLTEIVTAFDDGFISGIMNLLKTFNPFAIISNAMGAVVRYIASICPSIVAYFDDGLVGRVIKVLLKFNPMAIIVKAIGAIVGYVSGVCSDIVSAFDDGFITGVMNLFATFNPLSVIVNAIDSVIKYFTGVSLIDSGSQFISSFGDGLLTKWNSIKDNIIETVTGWVPDWVTSGVSSISNALTSSGTSAGTISAYANGGLITRPQIAQIGEDGMEMVIPLTKSNGPALLMDAAKMMGMISTQPSSGEIVKNLSSSVTNRDQRSSSVSSSFSPVITINTTSSNPKDMMNEIKAAMKDEMKSFEAMLEKLAHKKNRIGAY